MSAPRLHQTGLRVRGGAAAWDTVQAGVILQEDYFGPAAVESGGITGTAAATIAITTAAAGTVRVAGASVAAVGVASASSGTVATGASPYFPPAGNAVNFSWVGVPATYTSPTGNAVNFAWAPAAEGGAITGDGSATVSVLSAGAGSVTGASGVNGAAAATISVASAGTGSVQVRASATAMERNRVSGRGGSGMAISATVASPVTSAPGLIVA